jgi:hypothetical protein
MLVHEEPIHARRDFVAHSCVQAIRTWQVPFEPKSVGDDHMYARIGDREGCGATCRGG